jgi:cell division protein FtsW
MNSNAPFDHAAVMEDATQTVDAEHEELERRLQLVESRRARRSAARLAVRERRSVLLVVPVAMLLIIGLGAMLSASSVISIRETGDHLFYFKRQIIWVALGIVTFVAAMRIPYRWYRKGAFVIYLVGIAALIATLAIGDARGGAQRWIELGPITIQASEFAKLGTVILLAAVFAKKEHRLRELRHFLIPVTATLGLVTMLLLLQPDFGTAVIITATAFAVMAVSAAPIGYVAGLAAIGGVLGVLGAVAMPYRKARIVSFLDPMADPLGAGHQAVQSLVALGTGGWFGVGLGASRARWSFLPNAHTDFIFAIIGEETGLAGALLVVVLFTALAIVGVRIALKAPDLFGRLLATGIVAWISFQALINIGGVVAVLPITGVPLPFISAGGNAMVITCGAIGILVNIARTRSAEPAVAEPEPAS